jgi:hypothetical protein
VIVRRFGLLLVLGSIIVMAACGGSGGSSGSTVTSVSVSCSPTTVTSGGSSQCTATVSGTGNFSTSVTWSASAGSISTTGLLTAPVVTTSLVDTVTATSVQNTTIAGTAVVTVNPTASGGNVAPLTVDAGPAGLGYVSTNVAFTTVLVCIPNTTTCQTIDHVMVDTGSSGLRLLSAAAGGEFNLSLPPENDSNGNPLGECQVFLDGYVWGTVNTADVVMLGETGSSVPVQVILPSTSSPGVPSTCSSQNPSGGAGNEGDSLNAFGANGLIGVGLFPQDCGGFCVSNSTNPTVYYDCPSSGCNPTTATLAQQVPNPVTKFPVDNNGVVIELPSVPDGGSPTVSGAMIFGIGTQSNNGLGSAQVYNVPDSGNGAGTLTTTFNGNSMPGFLDSGSNGFFFNDSSITLCTGALKSWYCPSPSPDNLTASNQGTSMNTGVQVNFSIENAGALFQGANSAFSTLGGPYISTPAAFDWGLSFFYGKNVFTAIDGSSAPGNPPYFAY